MMRRRQDILFLGPALFRYQKERNEENMQFMIKAHDGDNMLEKRMEVRPYQLKLCRNASEPTRLRGAFNSCFVNQTPSHPGARSVYRSDALF